MTLLSRRALLGIAIAIGCGGGALSAPLASSDPDLSREALLDDPQTPVGGDPKGDVTIVSFFDYNCPYCMKAQPELLKLLETDKHIRVVYKDWPIFGDISVFAAKVALAANLQGRYVAVHDALMATVRKKTTEAEVRRIALTAGADMLRLDADLAAHSAEIDAILKRTDKQATAMGFEGTPVFLIGPFLVAAALDLPGFQKAVSDARERKKP
ncbi:DsbA family protein [Methylocella sp.]|jgi:protein-disulfide isomerase|uniref:DsbA family protein n=1 Tax=Methylocella sp. TaxID=1978226 RepID=UPI003C17255F